MRHIERVRLQGYPEIHSLTSDGMATSFSLVATERGKRKDGQPAITVGAMDRMCCVAEAAIRLLKHAKRGSMWTSKLVNSREHR